MFQETKHFTFYKWNDVSYFTNVSKQIDNFRASNRILKIQILKFDKNIWKINVIKQINITNGTKEITKSTFSI